MNSQNYTMLCDFYQLTMGNGYFKTNHARRTAYFDLFFRRVPDNGGYAICAGLEQVIGYIENLHFSGEDIDFLRSKGIFSLFPRALPFSRTSRLSRCVRRQFKRSLWKLCCCFW